VSEFNLSLGTLSKEQVIREQKLLSEQSVAVSTLSAPAHLASSRAQCPKNQPLLVVKQWHRSAYTWQVRSGRSYSKRVSDISVF